MVRANMHYSSSIVEQYDFTGKSTDEKPSGTFEGKQIWQGSTFAEMDTGKIFMYSEEDEDWIEFGGNS